MLAQSSIARKCSARRGFLITALVLVALFTLLYVTELFSISDRIHLPSTTALERVPPSVVQHSGSCGGLPLNNTKIALLIELRPMRTLIPILLHYMATLSEDWPFMLMHSAEVEPLLARSAAIKRYIASGKLRPLLLSPDVKLANGADVSEFLTKKSTWALLPAPAEHIFFFQLDAVICSNSEQTPDDYLHYDWIGAPWPHIAYLKGGNGGFSMRRKSRMLRCLETRTWARGMNPEDVWYSECMNQFPDAVMPTFEQGKEFAIEGAESPRYMGIHKTYNGITVASHYDFCPEAAMLFLP
ncbi:hypothetical protein BDZ88DRAFT_186068 [Geranomyces variabilis]|nr:hypothetical protein BDZ88DRAFT_186068 [Geranomyces variabilis]